MTDEQISQICTELTILPVSDDVREEVLKIHSKFKDLGTLSWYYKNKLKALRKEIDEYVGPWNG